jgi:hypothetical protein
MNKLLISCAAALAAVVLTGVAIGVDHFAPRGSWFGLLIWIVSMGAAVPLTLFGFNALCDKLTQRRVQHSSESATASATVRKNNLIRNGQHQNGKTPDRGAAIIAGREEATGVFVPAYDSTGRSVPLPKEKWRVGQ